YSAAAEGYTQLYNQVVALEKMPPEQARAQTSADLQKLDSAIQALQQQGYAKAPHYQERLQQAQQQLAAAQTTSGYFQVDSFVQGQLAAVTQVDPVYQQMRALSGLVDAQDTALGVVEPTPQPLLCAQESAEGGPGGVATPDTLWVENPTISIPPQGT